MIEVFGILILTIAIIATATYIITRKKNEGYTQQCQPRCTKCNKAFQQSPEYRCSTKCFDCVNNHRSLNHLNVSYGNANIYAV